METITYVSSVIQIRHLWILVLLKIALGQLTVNSREFTDPCLHFPAGYGKNTAPYNFIEKIPVEVEIGIRVWYITEVSLEKMAISVDLYLEFIWPDTRIDVNVSCLSFDNKVPEEEALRMWTPVVQYRNCKGCRPIRFDPKTYAFYYNRTSTKFRTVIRDLETFNCDFHLEAYPMDQQLCSIQIENYYEDSTLVRLLQKFNHKSNIIASNQTLSEFHVVSLSAADCTILLYDLVFSCIEIQIKLKRYLGFYVLTTYIPTVFLVIVSWISFWLPVDNVPGRVTLGMTSLLTLATRLDLAQKNLPSVSYIKAIDVWICFCLFSVFATLIEFAFATYAYQAEKKKTATQSLKTQVVCSNQRPSSDVGVKLANQPNESLLLIRRESKLDRIAQVVFPSAFLLFVIIYWSHYL